MASYFLLSMLQLTYCAPSGSDSTDTTHTESSKEVYTSYFSDGDYAFPSHDEITEKFIHSDSLFILSLLESVATLATPDVLHGLDLSFETCPAPKLWSGDYSRDLLVPQQYATIQAAIDVAVDYQSIIVDPSSTYEENLNIQNKFIHIFSATDDFVLLTPKNDVLPAVLFNCFGGGMIGGFSIEGGTTGVKASITSLGMTTIVNSNFVNITTPIVLIDTHFFIVDNVISGTTDGIILVKATGDVHGNTINGGQGISVYLDIPYGVTVSENQFTQTIAGQGALFINGGTAIIKNNTFTLAENAFGIFSQYASSDTGAGIEILDNTIESPKALGLVVFGETGNTTQAYIEGNTITGTQHALADSSFDWLSNYGEGNTFTSGNGIIVTDAVADAINNTTSSNYFVGLGYVRSCGTIAGNISSGHLIFDIVAKTFSDDDGCATPTLENNTYTKIWDDNTGDGQEMEVPNEPMKVPPLP